MLCAAVLKCSARHQHVLRILQALPLPSVRAGADGSGAANRLRGSAEVTAAKEWPHQAPQVRVNARATTAGALQLEVERETQDDDAPQGAYNSPLPAQVAKANHAFEAETRPCKARHAEVPCYDPAS